MAYQEQYAGADWQAIELEYKRGLMTKAAIARLYGITTSALEYRAKKANPPWERTPPIEAITDEVRAQILEDLDPAEFKPKSEKDILKLTAARHVEVLGNHRNDITKAREAANTLLNRLNDMLHNREIAGPFMGEKESPSDVLKKVGDTLRHLIPLERQAYGMAEMLPLDNGKQHGGVVYLPPKGALPGQAQPDQSENTGNTP